MIVTEINILVDFLDFINSLREFVNTIYQMILYYINHPLSVLSQPAYKIHQIVKLSETLTCIYGKYLFRINGEEEF